MADQATAATAQGAPPGWYNLSDGTVRYWDGLEWLEPISPSAPASAQRTTGTPKEPLSRGLKVWIAMLIVLALPLVAMPVGGFVAYLLSDPLTAVDAETKLLLEEIELGAPVEYGHGNLAVPVTVTNTGQQSADYYVEIYSTTADGVALDETNWITFEAVPPGTTAEAPVLFHPFMSDVEIFVKEATRTELSGADASVAALSFTDAAEAVTSGPMLPLGRDHE